MGQPFSVGRGDVGLGWLVCWLAAYAVEVWSMEWVKLHLRSLFIGRMKFSYLALRHPTPLGEGPGERRLLHSFLPILSDIVNYAIGCMVADSLGGALL